MSERKYLKSNNQVPNGGMSFRGEHGQESWTFKWYLSEHVYYFSFSISYSGAALRNSSGSGLI